jgi:hypothetical protein
MGVVPWTASYLYGYRRATLTRIRITIPSKWLPLSDKCLIPELKESGFEHFISFLDLPWYRILFEIPFFRLGQVFTIKNLQEVNDLPKSTSEVTSFSTGTEVKYFRVALCLKPSFRLRNTNYK